MLRNDLITLLAQHDNDPVTVNGCAVDVEAVTMDNGSIAIILNGDGLRAAQMAGNDCQDATQ